MRPISSFGTFPEAGLQDARLVMDCQSGNKAAWEALVKRHTSRIYGLCYRFTGRDCDARDVMQEVFLRVFCKLGGFRANQLSFVPWLTSVTHNVLVDYYRRNRNQRMTVSIEEQLPRMRRLMNVTDNPDRIFAEREACERLHSTLLKLAPNLREVIILCDLQEIGYRDIALALGIPEGTVKSRLNRGRRILAHLLTSGGQGAASPEASGELLDCPDWLRAERPVSKRPARDGGHPACSWPLSHRQK